MEIHPGAERTNAAERPEGSERGDRKTEGERKTPEARGFGSELGRVKKDGTRVWLPLSHRVLFERTSTW